MQLIAHTVALLVGCGLAAAASPPATHLDKRHDGDWCQTHCALAGCAMPDQDTFQLPLENYYSEQCPPIITTTPVGATQLTSKVCLSFPGTGASPSMAFTFAPFKGYTITSAQVKWSVKGKPNLYGTVGCAQTGDGGAVCNLYFSTIFPLCNTDRALLGEMCPNGDREALIFNLQFSGDILSKYDYTTTRHFVQQFPCAQRSNRVCTALDTSCDHIEVAYRCTKCNNPCPTSVPTSSVPTSSEPPSTEPPSSEPTNPSTEPPTSEPTNPSTATAEVDWMTWGLFMSE
jgi:hypothetical protein